MYIAIILVNITQSIQLFILNAIRYIIISYLLLIPLPSSLSSSSSSPSSSSPSYSSFSSPPFPPPPLPSHPIPPPLLLPPPPHPIPPSPLLLLLLLLLFLPILFLLLFFFLLLPILFLLLPLLLILFLHRIDIVNTNDNPSVSLDGENPIIMNFTIPYTEGSGPATILPNLFVVDNDPSPIIIRWDRNHYTVLEMSSSRKDVGILRRY